MGIFLVLTLIVFSIVISDLFLYFILRIEFYLNFKTSLLILKSIRNIIFFIKIYELNPTKKNHTCNEDRNCVWIIVFLDQHVS